MVIRRVLKESFPQDSDNIYNEKVVELLVEDGELSTAEAGFMLGYNRW